jgi:hypothetical protein
MQNYIQNITNPSIHHDFKLAKIEKTLGLIPESTLEQAAVIHAMALKILICAASMSTASIALIVAVTSAFFLL